MRRCVHACLLVTGLTFGSACGDPQIVVPDVMTIVALLPSHGSTLVAPNVQALAYFSHPAASSAEVVGAFSLQCLGAPTNGTCAQPDDTACSVAEPAATVTYDATTQVARLVPANPLQDNTCYVLIVSAGVESSEPNVGPLPVDVRSAFQTR